MFIKNDNLIWALEYFLYAVAESKKSSLKKEEERKATLLQRVWTFLGAKM